MLDDYRDRFHIISRDEMRDCWLTTDKGIVDLWLLMGFVDNKKYRD